MFISNGLFVVVLCCVLISWARARVLNQHEIVLFFVVVAGWSTCRKRLLIFHTTQNYREPRRIHSGTPTSIQHFALFTTRNMYANYTIMAIIIMCVQWQNMISYLHTLERICEEKLSATLTGRLSKQAEQHLPLSMCPWRIYGIRNANCGGDWKQTESQRPFYRRARLHTHYYTKNENERKTLSINFHWIALRLCIYNGARTKRRKKTKTALNFEPFPFGSFFSAM